MHINDEAIIATSYIAKDGDNNNRCFLSKNTLFVKYRGKMEHYSLESVSDIQFKHKLILFPLIAGGVIAPLCLLALLNSIGNPWLLLSGMVAGLLMIYYGYEGTPTLSINSKIKEYDFFIKKPTPNLLAFVKYVRQIYTFGPDGYFFYLDKLPKKEKDSYFFEHATKLLYYEDQLKLASCFKIDPLQVAENFTLKSIDNTITPVLIGKVNAEYITPVDS